MNTKKKILAVSLILLIASLAGWMIFSSVNRLKKKAALAAAISEMPGFVFLDMDSSSVSVDKGFTDKALIMIYFNSKCDYCREEAHAISDHIELFNGMELLFLSREPLDAIRNFAAERGLSNHENISFGKINGVVANDILGVNTTPQLYIYNRSGQLTKQFKGETKIETIVKYANEL